MSVDLLVCTVYSQSLILQGTNLELQQELFRDIVGLLCKNAFEDRVVLGSDANELPLHSHLAGAVDIVNAR